MALFFTDGVLVITATFAVGGTPTDPDTLTLTVHKPDGTATDYVYGTDAEVVKDATGEYHANIPGDLEGLWSWKWVGTGAAAGSREGSFSVEPSLITTPPLCSVADITSLRADVTGGARNDVILSLISRVSAIFSRALGRDFGRATVDTTRYFPCRGYVADREVLIDDLSATPTSVVVVNSSGDTVQTLTVATDVVLEPRNRPASEPITSIRLRPGVSMAESYEIAVTGKWGWPAVPQDVREAVIDIVIDYLESGQAVSASTPGTFDPEDPVQRAITQKARDIGRRLRWVPSA